jgi:hypothetical protein
MSLYPAHYAHRYTNKHTHTYTAAYTLQYTSKLLSRQVQVYMLVCSIRGVPLTAFIVLDNSHINTCYGVPFSLVTQDVLQKALRFMVVTVWLDFTPWLFFRLHTMLTLMLIIFQMHLCLSLLYLQSTHSFTSTDFTIEKRETLQQHVWRQCQLLATPRPQFNELHTWGRAQRSNW